jgi:hypothetical protein
MQATITRQAQFTGRAAGVKSAPRVAKACIQAQRLSLLLQPASMLL